MMTAEEIVERLEEAGAAMLAMPSRGYSTGLRITKMDVVHTALEAYGWESAKMKPPAPCAATVTRMDEAFGWLLFVPEKQYVLRRIAGARALVHPLTGRHLFSWRRLGEVLGADHKSVQRWHGQAIKLIQGGLAKR
ncbi:MAG: hypothetical protein KGL65_03830 [Rhodospirillales bacterium]|nr:hypothetical protein [Rhodospirillales bacterium]MDE2390719.1 hypothetical protein [Rhodospirillales bacterium]